MKSIYSLLVAFFLLLTPSLSFACSEHDQAGQVKKIDANGIPAYVCVVPDGSVCSQCKANELCSKDSPTYDLTNMTCNVHYRCCSNPVGLFLDEEFCGKEVEAAE